jgi:hypothetical protein
MTPIPPPHAPEDRVAISALDAGWEVRQFAEADRKLAYFAARGFAHLQLWQPAARVSVLTPSRITGGNFELWSQGARVPCRRWDDVADLLDAERVAAPGRAAIRALERWFILAHEPAAGRLLRCWWANGSRAR